MDPEKNIYKHNKPFQIQRNSMQSIKANSMYHQHLNNENLKIAKEFGFHYSRPHLQCLKFFIYPHNIHIEQEKHLSVRNTSKTIHANIGGNEKLSFFSIF